MAGKLGSFILSFLCRGLGIGRALSFGKRPRPDRPVDLEPTFPIFICRDVASKSWGIWQFPRKLIGFHEHFFTFNDPPGKERSCLVPYRQWYNP